MNCMNSATGISHASVAFDTRFSLYSCADQSSNGKRSFDLDRNNKIGERSLASARNMKTLPHGSVFTYERKGEVIFVGERGN